jgi:uncharacterized protein (TIGR02996 family)
MPRYELSDGKSNKFWEIELADDQFTVRYGRIGTDGQTQVKTFANADKAQKEYDKMVAKKVKKGYQLVAETAAEPEAEVTVPRNSELEQAIHDSPDDAAVWQVFGDWLQTQGDARGEMISLAYSGAPDAAARIAEIERSQRDTWVGPTLAKLLGTKEIDKVLELEWQHGFITAAKVRTEWEWKGPKPVSMLRTLLSDPSSRFLRRLALGLFDDEGENHYAQAILALTKVGKLPSLRHLHIGDFEYPDETEISWTEVGDVDKIYPVAPKLEVLHLQGGGIGLGDLRLARLRRLKLETGGLPAEAIRSVCRAELPELSDLEIWFGAEDYGAEGSIEMLAPLFAGQLFPKLTRLGLMNSEFADDIAAAIATAPVLAQIKQLDLSLGTMTDSGADAILAQVDRFRHLSSLNLNDNFISDEAVSRLRTSLGGLVTADDQEEPDDWDGEPYYYVSVGE